MKTMILAILALALTLVSCSNKNALRTELQSIESEMYAIDDAASRLDVEMAKSGINAVAGLIDMAQGLDSGTYGDAARGVNSAIDSAYQADLVGQSYDQLKARFAQLEKRRQEILTELN